MKKDIQSGNFKITIEDNSQQFLKALYILKPQILEELGREAEGNAITEINNSLYNKPSRAPWYIRTGALKNSIKHAKDKVAAYIGSNLKYAIYVELGTGIYADGGKGRKTPWIFRDENGVPHVTRGIRPHHFLKNAVTKKEYREFYKHIAEDMMKHG